MRESKPLPRTSGKYVYLDEGGLHTLLVKDSKAGDGGTYVCRACNLYGSADVGKAVRVVSPQDYTDLRGAKPAIIVSRPADRLNVAVGEDITVSLRVAGEPKPKGTRTETPVGRIAGFKIDRTVVNGRNDKRCNFFNPTGYTSVSAGFD